MVEKSAFPQIWGNPPDLKISIPPDLGESLKAQCHLTVEEICSFEEIRSFEEMWSFDKIWSIEAIQSFEEIWSLEDIWSFVEIWSLVIEVPGLYKVEVSEASK